MTKHTVGQRIGYVRVSSTGQNVARQLDGIELDRVFEDKCSGKDRDRPQLEALLKHVRGGDVVYVHSFDRLARNMADLLKLVQELTGRGVTVECVSERLTFNGSDDKYSTLLLHILGGVAQFERSIIRERQAEGVAIAKLAGKYRGGVPKLGPERIEALRARVAGGLPIAAAAREFGLSRQSVYSYLNR